MFICVMRFKKWRRTPLHFVLFLATVSCAHAGADTITDSAELKRQLQKTHEARLAFQRERKTPAINHGLYQDFRAVFVPVEGLASEEELIAAAIKARIQVIFLADRKKDIAASPTKHPGILVVHGIGTDK